MIKIEVTNDLEKFDLEISDEIIVKPWRTVKLPRNCVAEIYVEPYIPGFRDSPVYIISILLPDGRRIEELPITLRTIKTKLISISKRIMRIKDVKDLEDYN